MSGLVFRRTKALVADTQVPQVNAEIISTDVRLAVRVDRQRVDVVGMCVCVDLARNRSNDRIVVHKAGESQKARLRRREPRREARAWSTELEQAGVQRTIALVLAHRLARHEHRCGVLASGQAALSDRIQGLIKHFPELDGFVCVKTFHVPFVLSKRCAAFCLRHQQIWLIFSSISSDFR